MLWKRVSEILNFQNLIFIFLSQNLEGEKIKTDFTKLNFFSQKQKPIRNFFLFWPTDLIKLKLFLSNFDFDWFVTNFILKKNSEELFIFSYFLAVKKSNFESFQKWLRKIPLGKSRDFLMVVEITLKPKSRDYSLKLPVSKSPAQKFHLYFLLEILKIMCFLEKKFE